MKKIVFIALTALLLVGCAEIDKSYDNYMPVGYQVVVINGCEYIEKKVMALPTREIANTANKDAKRNRGN